MKITLKRAWVSKDTGADAVVDVQGVGEVKMQIPLPESILSQVEQFYCDIARENMRRTYDAGPTNPETLEAKGKPL